MVYGVCGKERPRHTANISQGWLLAMNTLRFIVFRPIDSLHSTTNINKHEECKSCSLVTIYTCVHTRSLARSPDRMCASVFVHIEYNVPWHQTPLTLSSYYKSSFHHFTHNWAFSWPLLHVLRCLGHVRLNSTPFRNYIGHRDAYVSRLCVCVCAVPVVEICLVN